MLDCVIPSPPQPLGQEHPGSMLNSSWNEYESNVSKQRIYSLATLSSVISVRSARAR